MSLSGMKSLLCLGDCKHCQNLGRRKGRDEGDIEITFTGNTMHSDPERNGNSQRW